MNFETYAASIYIDYTDGRITYDQYCQQYRIAANTELARRDGQ